MEKIKCGIDPAVPEDSDCANCCIYCKDKDTCEYACEIAKNAGTEDEILKSECLYT